MIFSLKLLAPVLALSAFSFLLLGVDAMSSQPTMGLRKISFWLTLIGLCVAGALIPPVPLEGPVLFGHHMLVWDGLSYFLSWIAVITVFLIVLLSEQYREFDGMRLSAYFGLLLLSTTGLIFVATANDFLMIFLAIELVGVPSFILVGYLRHREQSSEGAIKYFLIGAFSSAMLAYGISILYGLTGSTSLTVMREGANLLHDKAPLALLGIFFVVVSFGFKIALVPFHMWVPDAFEGGPTPISAYLSVAPKVAGVAIALRVFNMTLVASHPEILWVLAVLAALTMTLGNIVGLQQRNVVRMLAYSSIAHMGYLLLGLIAGNIMGITGAYLYGWVYLFMNLGAFGIVIVVSNAMQSSDLTSFAGLAKRSPVLAGLFVIFLMSLAGLPPTAGFVAKFYVFSAAYQTGWIWLVVVAAVNSVISVAYYFKILRAMYFEIPVTPEPLQIPLSNRLVLVATTLVTLGLGLMPQFSLTMATGLATPASMTIVRRVEIFPPAVAVTAAPLVAIPANPNIEQESLPQ